MDYHHDVPKSEAEHAHAHGVENRDAIDREAILVLQDYGRDLSDHDPTLTYPFAEMAKMVARRTALSRSTVIRRLEEACCEDPSAPFILIDNPNARGQLVLFNPNHQHYAIWTAPREHEGGANA